MRRAVARGRVFPQRYSTDRRYARLSLKALSLFPLMWVNADDQGRLTGDPEEIKYAVCPNIDHITKQDIPELLKELTKNSLIKLYNMDNGTEAIQLIDWWDSHRPQWAWPSEYTAPPGWKDHMRYKKGAREVITLAWFSGEPLPDVQVSPQVRENTPSGEDSGEKSKEEKETKRRTIGKGKGKGKGRGNSPEDSGEKLPSATPTADLSVFSNLFQLLNEKFTLAFGRKPDSRETTQLRDLGNEILSSGRPPPTAADVHGAFKEAAKANKMNASYVRAVLLDWLGIARVHHSKT